MSFDESVVGRWSDDRPVTITAEAVKAYADAIGDPGGGLSPVFAVAPAMGLIFEVAEQAVAPPLRALVVHGQEDLLLHRPLPVGEQVRVRAAIVGLHGRGSGTSATIKVETRDLAGALLNEQYVTEFYRGVPSDLALGESAPAAPREPVDGEPVLVETQELAEDLPRRYADASGDHNPIHLDAEFARAAGLPGVIVHGLASLAIAGRAVLAVAGQPTLRRLSCRFTRPIAPGDALTTRVYPAGDSYRFESLDRAGATVLSSGLATP